MKNSITRFSLVIIALVALSLLMSSRPAPADEAKQYIVVVAAGGPANSLVEKLEADVNTKLGEGWRLQGGIAQSGAVMSQAMVK